ncbi:HAMP domain-containing sensor histidine kinase [Micromonospora globbae]|uniref:HAMP domain-containing sensor histidine kinase n=1 Tax=Micromonospora globbae TaxID=1894969 RepID=UPI003434F985
MKLRLTARARLTVLYTGLVLASGLVLAGLTYLFMRRRLGQRLVRIDLRGPDGAVETAPRPEDLLPDLDRLRDATLYELLIQALIALAVVTALAALLGWLVAGRVLRPIRAISATAQRLSAENLSERVPVNEPRDELAALAATVNGMLDRIQAGVASQKLFTANAAHELRTPLTTMRTAIDVTLDGEPSRDELITMAEDIRTAIGKSQRTLDGLLALAHSQAATGRRRLADLSDFVGVPDESNLRPAPVVGDPVLLEMMVSNLVDNALRHNDSEDEIEVETGVEGGEAFLRISNGGPVITPGEAERLLEPFVRGEGGRTGGEGVGLGLAIVHAIVLAHRGRIRLVPRDGGGLCVTLHFPGVPVAIADNRTDTALTCVYQGSADWR